MLIAALLEVIGIGMIPLFLSLLLTPETLLEHPVTGDWLQSLELEYKGLVILGGVLLIGSYLLKNSYLALFEWVRETYVQNRSLWLKNRLFRAYLYAPWTFHIRRNSSELLRNVVIETNKVITGMLVPLLELLLRFTLFLFIIATLFYFEPVITLFTVFLMGSAGLFFHLFTEKKTNRYGVQSHEASHYTNQTILEALSGLKEVRVLKRESHFYSAFMRYAGLNRDATIYKNLTMKLPRPFLEMMMVAGIFMVTLLLLAQGREPGAVITVLALFGASAVKLMPIAYVIIANVTDLSFNRVAMKAVIRDLNEIEKRAEALRQSDSGRTPVDLNHALEIQNLTYRYPGSQQLAIDHLHFKIKKGEVVAFVGASGSGKTTLADLILGVLTPLEGTILADGTPITRGESSDFLNVGYIPQSIFLLDDTIRNNILFGVQETVVNEENYLSALRAAQLTDLIASLPDGDRTLVGERGIRLSGGQQQRIGIARALYSHPSLLVMDEATSALDNLTEKWVVEAIDQLRGNRTILMIAHRLTTVKKCDRIYLLEEGRITAEGTWDELLKNSETFRKMSLMESEESSGKYKPS